MKIHKITEAIGDSQILPELGSVGINLNTHPHSVSSGRKYMTGNMIPKSIRTKSLTPRMIMTGFETEYGKYARRIEVPCNMVVELVVSTKSPNTNEVDVTHWGNIYVIYYSYDTQTYGVLELPKTFTQNFYVGFEFQYNKEMLNRLVKGATFAKGEVFATSPGVTPNGEWMLGQTTMVAGMTLPVTEEDGVMASYSYLDRIRCTFTHKRKFNWNDTEYIPVMLYGTPEDPKPWPEPGEKVRSDGLVMAFRRRDSSSALTTLTKKALSKPDLLYDIKFTAPPGSTVKSVEVLSDRHKVRDNNKNAEKPSYQHTKILERYEAESNRMWNAIKLWYHNLSTKYPAGEVPPLSKELWTLVYQSLGNVTRDQLTNKLNLTKRTYRNTQLLDWNITIVIKEDVPGKVRFKLTDTNAGKSVIVAKAPDTHMPIDKYGRRAELVVNNTPAFRRQIYSSLMEAAINFININVFEEVKPLAEQGKVKQARDVLFKFYETSSIEFYDIVKDINDKDPEFLKTHLEYILEKEKQISIVRFSNAQHIGVELIRRLQKQYSQYTIGPVKFVNELGEEEETLYPVLIAPMEYMLLDKFGTDLSCDSFPKRNLFGIPSKLNEGDKYDRPYRRKVDRNTGETEARIAISQEGAEETARMLALANSPAAAEMAIRRIIRSEDPFSVPYLIKPSECKSNRALQLGMNLLKDNGYTLRSENENDKTS